MPLLTLDDLAGNDLILHRTLHRTHLGEQGEPIDLPTWPAVVVKIAAGTLPPAGAEPLGGPYWRVSDSHPLARARALVAAGAVDAFPDLVRHRVARESLAAGQDVTFDDPSYGGQWYLDELGMIDLYNHTLGSPEVRIAVVDSGIDIASSDLASKVSDPYDAFSDDDDPSPDPGEFCTDGSNDICDEHGTAVSGISLAQDNNGVGIVGMCPACTLIPIKRLGEGPGALSEEVAAYEHALEADAWVINNSWGFTQYTPAPRMLANLIEQVSTENRGGLGAVVVFAAGNDDRELKDDEVEALPTVLCISATDSYGNPTNYTNYGDPIDVAAPSATVSIGPGDTVITNFGGTSAASPVVAGLAGWILSANPALSAAEVRDLIESTAVQSPLVIPDDQGRSTYYGWGSISPPNILAELFPEQAETPELSGCACATTPGLGSGAATGSLVFLGLAAAVLRRRSS